MSIMAPAVLILLNQFAIYILWEFCDTNKSYTIEIETKGNLSFFKNIFEHKTNAAY